MTDASQPAADLIVVSDLHLGEGRAAGTDRYSLMEDFFYDDIFARLLATLREQYQADPARLLLVFNGDTFDFLTVRHGPSDEEAKAMGLEISPAERRFGLRPTAPKACFKLDQIVAGHRVFFAALAEFLAAGHRLLILRGNHDLELYFEAVQDLLIDHLTSLQYKATRAEIRARVEFCQWFYLEPGRVYIEHGNQYEASNSIRYPLHPLIPLSSKQDVDQQLLDYPLGSLFVRFFLNDVHRLTPFTPKVISFEQYLEFLRRHDLVDLIRIARAHRTFFQRALGQAPVRTPGGKSTESRAKQEEALDALVEPAELPQLHRQILPLMIHPLSASKAALVRQLARPLLRKVAWAGGLTFVCLYVWLLIFNMIQATPWLSDTIFGKATFLAIFSLLTVAAFLWTSNHVGRRLRRQADETVEMCADRARRIAELTGVKLVLMGHTHVADLRHLAGGQATYANSGTWTYVQNPWDRLVPNARRFTLLEVRGDTVRLCRWNDEAGRLDEVPLFDAPEQRGAELPLRRPTDPGAPPLPPS